MKKTIMIGLVLLVTIATVIGTQDVRGVSWGSTQEQVIEIEGQDWTLDSDGSIHYERTMLDKPMLLSYLFTDDKLTSVMCTILNADIWVRLAITLEHKYGEPRIRRVSQLLWRMPRITVYAARDNFSITLIYSDTVADEKEQEREKQQQEEQTQRDAEKL